MAGILLGVQAGTPQEVQEAFRLSETSHIRRTPYSASCIR